MQGDIVIERCVHTARAQPVGDRPQAQRPEAVTDGEAEQRRRRDTHADRRDHAGAEFSGQAVALQAGDDRPQRNDHGNDAGVGHRHLKFGVNFRPRRAEQRVRQSEADERKVDQRQ